MAKRRARVTKKATTRSEMQAEVTRKKARAKRRQLQQRISLGLGSCMIAYLGFAVAGYFGEHKLENAIRNTQNGVYRGFAEAGFTLQQVYLEGREHANKDAVNAAVNVTVGMPILALSLTDIQTRLEKIPEVHHARVTRELPNALRITLSERLPAVIWQSGGKQVLMDKEGHVLDRKKYTLTEPLPVVVGEGAPQHLSELLSLLNAAPEMKPDVQAVVRVGQRRWNVKLANGVTVMLPENAPEKAWQRFAGLVKNEALLSKAVRQIDMRMDDRIFITPLEQNQSPITLTTVTARDT
ncbi:MAG: cell division protein FtsQ/DivIB [Rickettsiales bacterium]